MARKTYALSDATYQALINHEADIAREMECDPSYIYGIKNHNHPDPFPKFRELYRAAAHAGGETSFWRNELNSIDQAARPPLEKKGELVVHLVSKLGSDATSSAEILKAIEDGHVDERECHRLLRVMENVRTNEQIITETLHGRLAELQESKPKNLHVM